MPKIIVKIPYMKASSKAEGWVRYIATRDGVDKEINQHVLVRKPTKKQKQYIDEMLKHCPDVKNTFEYEDYMENPTIQNASALISVAAEDNPEMFENREMYLNYIGTRPRVEKKGNHGLFGNEDAVNMGEARTKIAEHDGVIWMPIISLKREDAARLGYDSAERWRDLLRAKQFEIAEVFGIPENDFKWYAAFHNEGNHPHCHMVIYSENSKRGYIDVNDIEKIKSMLAREIFKDDMYQLYTDKDSKYKKISEESKQKLKRLSEKISKKDYADSPVCDMLIELSHKLRNAKGKKTYGYLPKSLKKEVDNIVKAMSEDSDIQKLYSEWCNVQKKIVGIYNDKEIEFPKLWENDTFKNIRNAVIKEAVQLDSDRFFVADEVDENNAEYESETVFDDEEIGRDDEYKQSGGSAICDYRGEYGKIRKQLEDENEFELKYSILMKEVERNNAPAFVDVGRLYEIGMGVEQNQETANRYYKQALELYLQLESKEENPFFEYQIAKLYRMETDFTNIEESVGFYIKAAEKGNGYAMYALGNAYFYGKGIETNYEKAYEWYQKSVIKGLPYACYRLGEMLRKGQGCDENIDLSDEYFSRAITNMSWKLEDEDYVSHYRLGKLFERGWGTEIDLEKAIYYYEKASEYNYAQAEFALARIYFRQGDGEKGEEYITRAIEHGNTYAQDWYEQYKEWQKNYYMPMAMTSALNLICRLAEIIDNDTKKHIDGHNKTIVDSKERRELAIKKQRLGIKMG